MRASPESAWKPGEAHFYVRNAGDLWKTCTIGIEGRHPPPWLFTTPVAEKGKLPSREISR